MEVAFLLGSLLALWAFIRWDPRRLSRTATSGRPTSAPRVRALGHTGLALLSAAMAVHFWLATAPINSGGHRKLLLRVADDALGRDGTALLLLLVAAGFAIAAWRSFQLGARDR